MINNAGPWKRKGGAAHERTEKGERRTQDSSSFHFIFVLCGLTPSLHALDQESGSSSTAPRSTFRLTFVEMLGLNSCSILLLFTLFERLLLTEERPRISCFLFPVSFFNPRGLDFWFL